MAEGIDNDILKRRAAIASVAVATLLVLAKLYAALETGAVTLVLSLADSMADLFASGLTYLGVQIAALPPDVKHRYGHGKAEALTALAQATFVAGSSLFVGYHGIEQLVRPKPLEATTTGVAVILFAVAVTFALIRFQGWVVRRTGSLAIEADSLHYRGDLLMNAAVLAGLLGATLTGEVWIDAVAGIGLAAWLTWQAWRIARPSIHQLMDRELPAYTREQITQIVLAHPEAHALHDLRTRGAGPAQFIELHLELDGALTLTAAHDITDAIEKELQAVYPNAEILIHQEPAGLIDHRLDHVIARAESGKGGTPTREETP